jgi:hypothetical protein
MLVNFHHDESHPLLGSKTEIAAKAVNIPYRTRRRDCLLKCPSTACFVAVEQMLAYCNISFMRLLCLFM